MAARLFSELRFLRCDWLVLKPITHIPPFQGLLWSSLLRHAYNPFLARGERFFQAGLRTAARDRGCTRFRTGDILHLFLALPREEQPRLARVLASLDALPGLHGQFQPGVTLRLLRVVCRLSRRPWPANPAAAMETRRLERAVGLLSGLNRFRLCLHGPLRLTMPPHKKHRGRYAGPAFFREDPEAANHLLAPCPQTAGTNLELAGSALEWTAVNYGRTTQPKVLGGVRGDLTLGGRLSPDAARALILHQFLGLGKNRALGFGNFTLTEIAPHLGIAPLPPARYQPPIRITAGVRETSGIQLLRAMGEDPLARL